MTDRAMRVRTAWFPRYSTVRALLPILNEVPRTRVNALMGAVADQRGTPQNPVDWSDPGSWIAVRLTGDTAALAQRIWDESNHTVNPRYIDGSVRLINNYGLLATDAGVYRLSERGNAFLNNDPAVLREVDDAEGVIQLLTILATRTRGQRGDLLPEWGEFLTTHTNNNAASVIRDTLRRRLVNLVERGLITHEGITYIITPQGFSYALGTSTDGSRSARVPNVTADPKREMFQAANALNSRERAALRQRLSEMHPYRFEQLVRDLLEAMGYEDVTVTQESGDRGVDVIASTNFGITTFKEVIQVKRHQGNIGRPVLDQLRGVLPLHNALRGTIITLSNFSRGCLEVATHPGAAPIGLMNGEQLIDELIRYGLGVHKESVPYYEVDTAFFEGSNQAQPAENLLTDAETEPD